MSALPSIETHLAGLPAAAASDDVAERDRAVAPLVREYISAEPLVPTSSEPMATGQAMRWKET